MKSVPCPPFLRLVLFAALPQETADFMRRTGPWSRLAASPCPAWTSERKDCSLLLVRTGMGMQRLPRLFKWAAAQRGCDLIVSFGFGGGLTPELQVGDLCLCNRFCRWNPERSTIDPGGLAMDGRVCKQFLKASHAVRTCVDVTTPRVASKAEIGRHLNPLTGGSPALVDMESHTLAQLAHEASIPFVTLRSVSDTLHDELDFDLSSIADGQGNVRVPQFAATVLRRPGLLRSFLRLWRDSRQASLSLGEATAALVSLPADQIRAILETSRVTPWTMRTLEGSQNARA
jgi:adenosylhomocysteine nucleosidase